MSKKLFENTEHYLAFRRAWAAAVNDKSIHLKKEHMLLYNLLRGRPFTTGFKPVHNKNKLMNGTRINHGLFWACYYLRYYATTTYKPAVERFLRPFGGIITDRKSNV